VGGGAPRGREEGTVYVGALTLDVLLGDVRSLKQKRSAVRSIIAEVRRRQPTVAVAETGSLDRYRRTEIGVAVVAATAKHVTEVLDACERLVAARPEIELLSARHRLVNDEEE
jgi:uncharacterized protein YlxP (DUF503 family)